MSEKDPIREDESVANDHDVEADDSANTDERLETTPTLRPTIVWLLMVVVLGLGVIIYLSLRRENLTNPEAVNILIQVISVLTLIGVVRFLVRLYVLKRTRYVVDPTSVTRQYDLLFRSRRREVPFTMVRSNELRQSRIQKLLGYGTITLNEGLGPMELENIPEPYRLYDAVQRYAREATVDKQEQTTETTASTSGDD